MKTIFFISFFLFLAACNISKHEEIKYKTYSSHLQDLTISQNKKRNCKEIGPRPTRVNDSTVIYEKIKYLHYELGDSIKVTPYFKIELMADSICFVKELKGVYYKVTLTDPKAIDSLHFPIYQYTLDSNTVAYHLSIQKFFEEIKVMQNYQDNIYIFAQGSADRALGFFIRGLLPDFSNRKIQILKKSGLYYDLTPVDYFFTKTYGNAHLPNLRSTFLRDELLKYGTNVLNHDLEKRVMILDGIVTPSVNPADRKVTFIMYVDWDKIIENIENVI